MKLSRYFGYGSLVNRLTRPAEESAVNARLKGWRRAWAHRVIDQSGSRNCTSLTVEPIEESSAANAGIDGVLVSIPADALPVLDQREAGYERVQLSIDCFDIDESGQLETAHSDEIIVYRSLPQNRYSADDRYPILHSYINCVMAGYHDRFGDIGLQAMLESTLGWERAIRDDRENPLYPRHVQLDSDQYHYLETLLNRHLGRIGH